MVLEQISTCRTLFQGHSHSLMQIYISMSPFASRKYEGLSNAGSPQTQIQLYLQGIVDDALEKTEKAGHKVSKVLVYDNKTAVKREAVNFVKGRDIWWDEAINGHHTVCEVEWMDAEEPLFKVTILGNLCIYFLSDAKSILWVLMSDMSCGVVMTEA